MHSVIKERVIKQPGRAEADRFFNYPYEAIEEALANAVYHKGYDIREPIEVRVEKDRIEIVSFPGPDRSVTVEGLKEFNVFNRRYRNRRIGDFLKELQLTEGRNTGIRKILKALEKNGSPVPEFETDENRDYFITRLFIHPGFKITNQATNQVANQATNQEHNLTKINENMELAEIERKILVLLNEDERLSQKKISNQIGEKYSKTKYYMEEMKKKGILSREGTSQKGRWIITL